MIYEREKRFVRVNSKARVNGRITLESSLTVQPLFCEPHDTWWPVTVIFLFFLNQTKEKIKYYKTYLGNKK